MEKLIEIALHDEDWQVRRDAVQKIDYDSLSAGDKKSFQHIYLNDPNDSVRAAALERIAASYTDIGYDADEDSAKKPQVPYEKHGAMKDAEPKFQPNARGVFMVLKSRKNLDYDQTFQVNMHSQMVLKAESVEYRRAQGWWNRLPRTPDRQKDNLFLQVKNLDDANPAVQDWIDKYEDYDGLVYIFCVERKLNLRTNETERESHIPVMAFNASFGFRTMDDIIEDECVTYRMYFAFFEKR